MEELRERYRQITLTDDKQFPIHLTLNGRKPQKLTLSAVEELIKELTQAIAQPPQAEEAKRETVEEFIKTHSIDDLFKVYGHVSKAMEKAFNEVNSKPEPKE